jgi:cob(I)alamin adenosyltransferase
LKIYTKTGDEGETRLLFGGRVSKADPRCEAYGATDLAVSAMGLARGLSQDSKVKDILLQVQNEMFTVGAELATDASEYQNLKDNYRTVTADMVTRLEELIDELDAEVELPAAFIIPGASAASGALDMARSQLRTGERRAVELKERGLLANPEVIRYLNRLSDLLFMLARYEDRRLPLDVLTGTARRSS